MALDAADERFVTDYKAKKFHFCSFACQTEFEKNPEKYAIAFEPIKVKQIMNTEVEVIGSDSSALEVAKRMSSKGRGCMLVLEGGKAVGMITERDLVGKVLAEDISPSKLRATDIMTAPLIAVEPEATVEEASRIMSQYSIRRLPVVKGGTLVGLITSTDIALRMAKEKQFKDHRLNALARYCVSPQAGPYE
ncbi:MAG: CBS domain-containing protein [Nitrososphaerales archaeon]|nr:CBS domain-containing protein [Nitrososphaerales archaeon]